MVVLSHGRLHVKGGLRSAVVRQSSLLLVKDKKYFNVLFTFGHSLKDLPTYSMVLQIWEDSGSCILMSENPTNRERSFFASAYEPVVPAYVSTSRKGTTFTSSKPLRIVSVDNVYIHHYRGRAK